MILGNVAITAGTALGNFNDPNYNNVGLLLTGAGGTNGATNNTFLDSSSYGQTVTRNGDVTQGAFTPYLGTGYYGAYFDGTGDSLSITGNAGPEGTENFTVEMWLYITTMGGSFPRLFESTTANAWQLYLSSGTLTYGPNGGSTLLTYSISSLTNQWLHICITRSGSAARMFVNGVLQAYTASGGTNFASSTAWRTFNEGGGIVGNISNLRVVRGSVVTDYSTSVTTTGTTVFTPPTAPLVAVAGTSLLMCQSNRFIDNSPNNFTITRGGDTRVVHFNPFTWNGGPYTTTFNGGSMYFDGSGDYLTAPASSLFQYTGAYTIEAWVYPLASSGSFHIFGTGSSGQSDQFNIVNGVVGYGTPSNTAVTGPSNVIPFAWNHIAVTRDASNVYRVYVNGVSGTSVTESGTAGRSNTAPFIGVRADGSNPLTGYISNLRVVNGTAVYSGATSFTPATQPLQPVFNTTLLLNGANAGIIDRSENTNLVTVADARLSNTQTRYNPTSIFFDGTGDALYAPWSPSLEFGAGNFTIEFWAYVAGGNSLFCWSADFHYGMTFNYGGATGNRVGVWASSNGTTWNIFNADGGGNGISTGTITLNTWTYVTLVRNGSTWTLYLNGTSAWTGTSSATIITRSTDTFRIGGPWPGSGPTNLNGYIDDFRITPGVARYTANFTPPTYSPLGF